MNINMLKSIISITIYMLKKTNHNIMYKALGIKWLHEVFCPALTFVSADREVARNPQRFIHVTVVCHFPNQTEIYLTSEALANLYKLSFNQSSLNFR